MLEKVSWTTVRKYWALITALGVLGAGTAFALSALAAPLYRSTAALYFTLNFGNTANELAQGSTYTANQILSFGQLATSPVVLDPVIARLDLGITADELARTVTISTPRDTVIMEIAVTSTEPQQAADIANAISAQASEVIESFAPQTESGKPSVQARPIAEATRAEFQFSPDKRINTAAGLGVGLLLGVLVAFALAILDNRVRNAETLRGILSVPSLGALRRRSGVDGHEVVVLHDPASQAAEEYRQFRSNLQFATMRQHPLVIVVSSSVPSEGKTTVATNLAAVLAESGQRILLIDADLRKPRVAAYTHVVDSIGLAEVLVGVATLAEATQSVGDSGVDVLVGGALPPNPGELVASSHMAAVLAEARGSYDVVVVDTAPILAVADALSITHIADGIVLVARAGTTVVKDLQRSLDAIHGAGGQVYGVVINGAKLRSDRTLRDYQYGARAIEDSGAGKRISESTTSASDSTAAKDPRDGGAANGHVANRDLATEWDGAPGRADEGAKAAAGHGPKAAGAVPARR